MAAGSAKPFGGTIGKTVAGSKPWWPQAAKPPQGAPNILVVLFDDVGFSDFGCYGSPIRTPTIDKLAAEGLRYSGFHTTAMCSTTRAALLTGRNHHSVGVGCLANFDSGYPGYRGKIAREAGTLAEMLRPHGYRNYMVGKWHVTPLTESGATGPFDGWPLGRGFDRFYGFLDAETDQYAPELVSDNTHIDPPGTYADGYHLTSDLVDQSIRFIADHTADRPDIPWLTWVALGACHAPHQAPMDIIKSYDAMFAHGWDVEREQRMARQKAMGIVPQETRLPARNDGVKAWDEHSADEKRVFTRLQAAFAGMLDHADQHLARLIAFLDTAGIRDNTLILVLSDNGASQEGGPLGFVNAMGPYNFRPEPIAEKLRADRRYRRAGFAQQFSARLGDGVEHAAAPLQAEHPWRRHPRSLRDDLAEADRRQGRAAPSIRPCLRPDADLARPDRHRAAGRDRRRRADADRGRELCALDHRSSGAVKSLAAIFRDVRPSRDLAGRLEGGVLPSLGHAVRERQMGAVSSRTGFFAKSTISRRRSPSGWQAMIKLWWSEAEKHNVLPLDDRFGPRFAENAARFHGARNKFTFHAGMGHVPTDVAPDVRSRSYTIEAHVEIGEDGAEGVLIAHGDATSGYSLYIKDGLLVHDLNIGGGHEIVTSNRKVPSGAHRLGVHVERLVRKEPPAKGSRTGVSAYTLLIDGEPAGSIADPAWLQQFHLVVRPRHRPRPLQPGLALRGAVRIHRAVAAGDGRHA